MRLTGGEYILEYLICRGVPYMAGIPGHGCLALMDALKGREGRIKALQVRHEQSAVHLADGYFRVKGEPLAVFTSIGPGAINTAVGLASAYVDSIPVLVMSGETHTHMLGRGVLQEVERRHWANLPRVLEPVVKRYWQVTRVEQLPHVLTNAFSQMLSGRPGPVFISLPMDVQADDFEAVLPEAWGGPVRQSVKGDPGEIHRAVLLLAGAKRPVILAGGGVNLSGAFGELRQVAETLGAAVVTTFQGKGCFPEDHPLYGWHTGSKGTSCGNALTRSADVILAVGCRFADETTSSYRQGASFSIPPTRLIHVDIDPQEIGKNYQTAVGIVADAKSALADLAGELREFVPDRDFKATAYFRDIQSLKEKWFKELAPLRDSDRVPMTVSRFYRELRAALPRDGILLTSSGHAQAAITEFPVYEPRCNITTGGFSTMGFSVPAALGVKLAAPGRQAVAVVGDGDFMMTMQELATAVQYDIPIVLAVLNNKGWYSIRDLQMTAYGHDRLMMSEFRNAKGDSYTPRFAEIAREFGAHSERIEKPDDVEPALRRAFQSGKPALVEVMVCQHYPESGGLVTGWWDVPVPAYLKERREKYLRERKDEYLGPGGLA
jgi:acetolactate synthase-1/2/3 large subunit